MNQFLSPTDLLSMLPKPEISALSVTSPPPTLQPQQINIQVDRTDQQQYPQYPPPPPPQYPYPITQQYPSGLPYLPGGLGGIQQSPGMANVASIKIGEINSTVSQGNSNWGGSQTLTGSVFPTSNPSVLATTAPPQMIYITPSPYTSAPLPPPSSGTNWTNIALMVCVGLALAIASYILYTRFIQPSNKKNNANAGNKNRPPKNNALNNGANDDGFGDEDFGNEEAPPR